MTPIPNPLWSANAARPTHPAVILPAETLTFGELATRASRRATTLRADGVRPGDVLVREATPDAAFVVDLHAAWWLGAALAPLPHAGTPEEHARARRAIGPARDLPAIGAPPPPGNDGLPGIDAEDLPLDRVALVLCTSGTTGDPRAVPLSWEQLVFSAFGSALRLGHLPTDRWVDPLPLHHTGGLSVLVRTAIAATTTVLLPRFSPDALEEAVRGGAAIVSVVPTMLSRWLDHRGETPIPPTLRAVLVGGAGVPDALITRALDLGVPLCRSWGMTETASQIATTYPGDRGEGAPPLAFVRVAADADERLVVRGPTARGTLTTSDRGAVDPEGRVRIFGRVDDVILRGGENLDPALAERAARAVPGVREVVMVGRPHPELGEVPWLFVVGEAGEAELAAAVRAACGRAYTPAGITFVADLPRNALGKVERRRLRETP